MKLKNKKTGEIIEVCKIYPEPFEARDFDCKSLAELNTEWEDYEEPKDIYWCMDDCGRIEECKEEWSPIDRFREEIGNYFGTEEEAKKAVEKLKAWKRLKDTITRIDRASFDDVGTATLFIRYDKEYHKKVKDDLNLLFRGEE